jgi:hypothetical protein
LPLRQQLPGIISRLDVIPVPVFGTTGCQIRAVALLFGDQRIDDAHAGEARETAAGRPEFAYGVQTANGKNPGIVSGGTGTRFRNFIAASRNV